MLVRGSKLVKGKQFKSWRSIGHAAQAAQIHAARGVDELIMLDISADRPNIPLVRELSQWCFTPLTIGGGVKSLNDISNLLNSGADKVSICSAATDAEFITSAAKRFGSQCITLAIDYRVLSHNGVNYPAVMTNRGKEWNGMDFNDGCLPIHPVAWARRAEDLGAGEILLTDIDREGMMNGYDLDMIRTVSEEVSIPVIAHGGCGMPWHCLEAIRAGANAVAIGSMFCFMDETPRSVAEYLNNEGIEVRLET
jgi:imidazole glycerol-phosphate synthase subunit HisF